MAVHASSLLDDAAPTTPLPPQHASSSTTGAPSPAAALPGKTSPGQDFGAVLDAALDPALGMCSRMGELRPVPWDRWVFEVNCLGAARAALEGFEFATERRERLEEKEAEVVEKLTAEHVSRVDSSACWLLQLTLSTVIPSTTTSCARPASPPSSPPSTPPNTPPARPSPASPPPPRPPSPPPSRHSRRSSRRSTPSRRRGWRSSRRRRRGGFMRARWGGSRGRTGRCGMRWLGGGGRGMGSRRGRR